MALVVRLLLPRSRGGHSACWRAHVRLCSTKMKRCMNHKNINGVMLCRVWRTITPVARAVRVLWGTSCATAICQKVPRRNCVARVYEQKTAKQGWLALNPPRIRMGRMTGPTVLVVQKQTHRGLSPFFDHNGGAHHSTFPDIFPVSEDATV